MITLGIETSCDETAISIVEGKDRILSNEIASSSDIHEKFGGVFPELACRRHIDVIEEVCGRALKKAGISIQDVDLIAVTKGPGLIGALLIGMNFAKGLSIALNKPFIGVNHVEAHLYASMMGVEVLPLPALGIVLSGGHTFLIQILDIGSYLPVSTTVDDAIGEAFDKVGTLLGLKYPGGPRVERLAQKGDPLKHPFKAGYVKKNPLHFSFSGLKTSVLYTVQGSEPYVKEDIAASFQHAAFSDVIKKAKLAMDTFEAKALFFGGGVTANLKLREMVHAAFSDLPVFWPKQELALDNAAMIAGLGANKFLGLSDSYTLQVQTRIPICIKGSF